MSYASSARVVDLEQFQAMCRRLSGMCHRFTPDVGKNQVVVWYSNPDEYGHEHPFRATFPMFQDDGLGPVVVMHMKQCGGGDDGWQAFYPLVECPQLYRLDAERWGTQDDLLLRGRGAFLPANRLAMTVSENKHKQRWPIMTGPVCYCPND